MYCIEMGTSYEKEVWNFMKINLLDHFENTVAKRENMIAVVHNQQELGFAELQAKSKKLATSIVEIAQSVINTPVAVFLPKEINTVIADLGVMYSCNPFMNLDVKTPIDRIQNIVNLVKPCAIITNTKLAFKLETLGVQIILVDEIIDNKEMDDTILMERRQQLIDTDPLCIINTSGSTGTPKGVVLNHRSFFDFMDWSFEEFGFDGSEILGSLSPVVFDIFDFELCLMMLKGSRMILLDTSLASFPVRLLESLNQHEVNFIFWVPSIMVNIANMELLDKVSIPSLKMIWFAGEVFPTKQFLYWYDHLQNTTFVNMYGPIEITLDCTFHTVTERPDENIPLPIGFPCRNTNILILNDKDVICQEGEEGELCVRGTSLAMGYYNNPEKTALAFTQNPLNHSYPEFIYRTGDMVYQDGNGVIHFKGRKDSLIKHMGYRIELGEIEHEIINELGLVEYCCAVYQYEKKEIVLYYEKDTEITSVAFRKALSGVFPAYMIPTKFIRMDLLPRNTNGKIDRLLLKNKINKED